MSFQKGIELILEAHTVLDGMMIGWHNDIFDALDTDINGLNEFLRNIDTAHIRCSEKCAKELLQKCNLNSGRIFLYREFPSSRAYSTIHGGICIGDSNQATIVIRKSLNLPYDDLITNFKIREGSWNTNDTPSS